VWPLDETGSHRVQQNVFRGFREIFSSPQDVIKKGHLPECFSGFGPEMECGFVFEGFDEAQEICRPGIALHQYMQVIRIRQ